MLKNSWKLFAFKKKNSQKKKEKFAGELTFHTLR
jgi:hypothetical protein